MTKKTDTAFVILLLLLLTLVPSCRRQQQELSSHAVTEAEEEDADAKAMLQGIWIDSETEKVAFKAQGDTIYYTDSTSQPAYFRFVHDSLELGGNRYPVIQQREHLFSFQNQSGDVMRMVKSESADDTLAFVHHQPEVLTLTEVLKIDSVVNYDGQRYHWYIAINPTRYRVVKTTYNSEGVGVENVYFDNIIHISLYHGSTRVFSQDFRKQMYSNEVPPQFLNQAILGNMQYDHVDNHGVHFNATLCIPDEPNCYLVETLVGFDGHLSMKLLEY